MLLVSLFLRAINIFLVSPVTDTFNDDPINGMFYSLKCPEEATALHFATDSRGLRFQNRSARI